jgi:hypothetical protein
MAVISCPINRAGIILFAVSLYSAFPATEMNKITGHFPAQNYVISTTITSLIFVNFALWKNAVKSCI